MLFISKAMQAYSLICVHKYVYTPSVHNTMLFEATVRKRKTRIIPFQKGGSGVIHWKSFAADLGPLHLTHGIHCHGIWWRPQDSFKRELRWANSCRFLFAIINNFLKRLSVLQSSTSPIFGFTVYLHLRQLTPKPVLRTIVIFIRSWTNRGGKED